MRVLVCGSRDFEDREKLILTLDDIDQEYGFTSLIHGDQRGADRMAGRWGRRRGLPVTPYPADWKHFGKAAGPFRNRQMLVEGKPELVVAFPLTELAESTGTKDMVTQAMTARVETIVIEGDTLWTISERTGF